MLFCLILLYEPSVIKTHDTFVGDLPVSVVFFWILVIFDNLGFQQMEVG